MTNTSNVTLGFAANPAGGVLSGTTTVAAVAGIATFGNLSIAKAGTGYTLSATDGSLTGSTSTAFAITAAAAHHLAFVQQPTNVVAGQTFSPTVAVQVRDQFNNLVTSDTSFVTLQFGNNAGPGTLGGTTSVESIGGVATFNKLFVDKVGVGSTLTALDGGLTGPTSGAFKATAPAASSRSACSQNTLRTKSCPAVSHA